MKKPSNRIVLVTGGARGLGQTIAQRLAAEGHTIILGDILYDLAKDTAAGIASQYGIEALALKLDVSDAASVKETAAEIDRRFGKLDILVNNAAVLGLRDGQRVPLLDMPLELWERTLKVNLTGTFLMCQALIPLMQRNKWGRVINISSRSARAKPVVQNGHYAATKSGVLALSRAFAAEVGKDNITVNCVAPSKMQTEMTATQSADYFTSGVAETVLGRLPTPNDVASSIAFLCSDEAGAITGTVLDINSGAYMP